MVGLAAGHERGGPVIDLPNPDEFSLAEWYLGAVEAFSKGHHFSACYAAKTFLEQCLSYPRQARYDLPVRAIPNAIEIHRQARAMLSAEKASDL
jgi:hypothetical protein